LSELVADGSHGAHNRKQVHFKRIWGVHAYGGGEYSVLNTAAHIMSSLNEIKRKGK
jgi:hypothetical protein